MTHEMTAFEKRNLLEEIRDLVLSDVLQREDMIEINKIMQKAVQRTIAAIDDPFPIREVDEKHETD